MKWLSFFSAVGLAACATTNTAGPATMGSLSSTDRATIGQAVYNAMGQRNVSFDANDLMSGSMVVKPRSDGSGRIMGRPEMFDLVVGAGGCSLVQRETGVTQPLPGLSCAGAAQTTTQVR